MFNPNRTPGELRRIVTGFTDEGKSLIQSDELLKPRFIAPAGTSFSSTIWSTSTSPADVLDPADGATRVLEGKGIRSPNGRGA
jgi:hypothetical protein